MALTLPLRRHSYRSGQAALEMLIAFMELLVVLQLLSMLAKDGSIKMISYSDAETRTRLSQDSLVIGMRISDLQGRYVGLSGLPSVSITGSGQQLIDPLCHISVLTLPFIELDSSKIPSYAYIRKNEEIPA